MSGIALIWAANVKGLKPATKICLIMLAERHNKDTGRCDPSINLLADDCEMDRASVFRHLKILEEAGLITRHAKGDGMGGRGSNQYTLHQDIVMGPSSKHKETSQNATGGNVAKTGGKRRKKGEETSHGCDGNLKEPGKNLKCANAHTLDGFFDEFWEAHPRAEGLEETRQAFDEAVSDGIKPELIVFSAKAYRAQQESQPWKHLKSSIGWLKSKRFKDFEKQFGSKPVKAGNPDGALELDAKAIIDGKRFLCTSIRPDQARAMIAREMVTLEQCKSAGVAV